jgi:hypothetical protein
VSGAFSIRSAVYAALRANAALTALLAASTTDAPGSAIYDQAPQPADAGSTAGFPYVVIGDTVETPFDTDTSTGRETVLTLHTWSVGEGQKEANGIMDAVKAVLHDKPLAVAGEITVLVLQEFSEVLVDADGATRHGVQRFRIITEGT